MKVDIAHRSTRNPATTFLAAAMVTLVALPSQAAVSVNPVSPAAGSVISIEGLTGCYGAQMDVTVTRTLSEGLTIIKVFDPLYFDTPLLRCPSGKTNAVSFGPVTVGRYRVEHHLSSGGNTFALGSTTSFEVTSRRNPSVPARWLGYWWMPSQPGWALHVDRDPATGNLFAAWYTHERHGATGTTTPTWVVSPNLEHVPYFPINNVDAASVRLAGDIYRAQGSRSLLTPNSVSPALPSFTMTADRVGSVTMDFVAPDRMIFSYTLSGSGLTFTPSAGVSTTITNNWELERFRY